MSRDDREEEPDSRSLSLRMWSTSDRRRSRASLDATNSLRMYRTSDGSGGNLRVTPSRTRPTDPLDAIRKRLRRLQTDYGDGVDRNPRTNRWTAPWKPAPAPGTVKDARARLEQGRRATQFRKVTSVTEIRTRVAARRGGFATSPEKTLAARRNAIKGGRYGYKGGRPRTAPNTAQAQLQAADQVRGSQGPFTSATARQAGQRGGSRTSPAKVLAARSNARRPRARPRPVG